MDKIKWDRAWEYCKELKPFLLYMWIIFSLLGMAFAITDHQAAAAVTSLLISITITAIYEFSRNY